MNEMDAIIAEFLIESRENLEQFERDLLTLESDPANRDTLAKLFRSIHSLKGATGFLGLMKMSHTAHAGENLLSLLRDQTVVITPEMTTAFLSLVDALRQMLAAVEHGGAEGDGDYTVLIEQLTRLQTPEDDSAATPAVTSVADPSSVSVEPASILATDEDGLIWLDAEPVIEPEPVSVAAPVPTSAMVESVPEPPPSPEPPMRLSRRSVDDHESEPQTSTATGNASSNNIRVDVKHLDALMNLVGELVLTRNEMLRYVADHEDSGFDDSSQRLNSITAQLQEGIMKTRMQPIENVWRPFPRLVRDASIQCNKDVRLEMEGKDTELDKTLLEAIKDPLTHLLRNAVDHGLESPGQRVQVGKPIAGRLVLRAFHEGGQVNIEVSDDGSGIDVTRVKQKAVDAGLITPDAARDMGDQEAMNLIFLAGFSTAEAVTNLSGRGVGMDVVKTNIEKIGGRVSIHSQRGVGTTVKIRIPLTLTIMSALVVAAAGQRYAVPQSTVLELLRFEGEDEVRENVQMFRDAEVFRLREEVLPLIRLDVELGVRVQAADSRWLARDEIVNIVVLEADEQKFGLVVDDVNDTQEIVVKPLGKRLSGCATFAGATITGDGRVVLILDIGGLAVQARVLSGFHDVAASGRAERAPEPVHKEALLLFAGTDDARMAVPLAQVIRLEEFDRATVEQLGGRDVVQYMGAIMPLARISELLEERRQMPRNTHAAVPVDAPLSTIICANEGRLVGFIVDRIIDTTEESLANLTPASRLGVAASMVIDGRVTEILDLQSFSIEPVMAPAGTAMLEGAA